MMIKIRVKTKTKWGLLKLFLEKIKGTITRRQIKNIPLNMIYYRNQK